MATDCVSWWSELRQNGMILSPTVLSEFVADGPMLERWPYERLRDAYTSFISQSEKNPDASSILYQWFDTLFQNFLVHPQESCKKHGGIPEKYKVAMSRKGAASLRPDRLILHEGDQDQPRFLVLFDTESSRIGMHRGRAVYSSFLDLLRGTGHPVGILTNGRQFRLVYAGIDYDCWVEWDVDRWFEDDAGRAELEGFLQLCGPFGTTPREDPFPLLAAIQKSRTKQGELSQVLGEQTRQAVEKLLKALDKNLRDYPELREILARNPETGEILSDADQQSALYQASIRLIMRLVVILFAEARGMLPTDQIAYYESYGIEGLFISLKEAASVEGEAGLAEQFHAWSQLLSLFRLLHEGSDLPDLPMPAYGGALFQSGEKKSQDVILRALSLFEDERATISDLVIFEILKLLKVGKIKAKVGRATRMVSGAVDFSDLRTEYIGMMYEGLLDYQLRVVKPEEEAIIFLNVGNQPALPFSLLKGLSDNELKDLIKKLGKEQKEEKEESEEGEEEEDEEEQPEEIEEEESGDEEEDTVVVETSGVSSEIISWAERVVEVVGLVKRPRRRNADPSEFTRLVRRRARSFISEDRVVLPGEMYLIRASGTRKGSGSFYTKPQLAVPTVHRTLEPLAYDVTGEGADRVLTPKKPEEILALKVCDPAMGSASFLVAALRFLSDALYESLWYHNLIPKTDKERRVLTLPFGEKSSGAEADELFPCRSDEDAFEPRTKARLKRYVVERCIYGVDLNPVAVELGKLSLWIETMDEKLPFSFLDHKIHVGNSLVGCWLDNVSEYPVMAWMRETGDEKHAGVHHQAKTWSNKLKEIRDTRVKPEMIQILQAGGISPVDIRSDEQIRQVHAEAVRVLEEIHDLSICESSEEREMKWRGGYLEHPDIAALKDACDLWCAIWFWPGKWYEKDIAPTPNLFYHPTEEIKKLSRQLAEEMKFFHWELMFPDVFVKNGGFDAVLGNPPWEISKPKSHEFYTVYDPIFRTRGKQEALTLQDELFRKDAGIEEAWLLYVGRFKEMGNWVFQTGAPYGDRHETKKKLSLGSSAQSKELHARWSLNRREHITFADQEHPFIYQGSADINTYKLFLEFAHAICRTEGRIGIIVPSGIYTDDGTRTLRELFLDKCKWEWLFGFENKKKIFDIHRSYKFCPLVITKGGKTSLIRTAFMQQDIGSWEHPWQFAIPYYADQIRIFSPNSRALLEIRSPRDLEIMKKIYSKSVLLGDQGSEGWGITYSREFDMTNDSHLFPPVDWWKERGYLPDEYGRWLPPAGEKPELVYRGREVGPAGDIALPLYEGRMIGQFDFSQKGWVSGRGRGAIWRDIPWDDKKIEPQFLISKKSTFQADAYINGLKFSHMRVGSATNKRTIIGTLLNHYPGNDTVAVIQTKTCENVIVLNAICNSFAVDYNARLRVGGLHIDYHVIAQIALVPPKKQIIDLIIIPSIKLSLNSIIFADLWIYLLKKLPDLKKTHWKSLWAITLHERLRLRCILDAIITEFYGLDYEDFAWILKDCGYQSDYLRSLKKTLDPKGFWRVDQTESPELRHTVLALKAFADLKKMGLEKFCALNDGNGWMIPETLTYTVRPDGTVEFDTPDGITVPVREKLGSRFLDWQLEGTVEESWAECERHALAILGDEEFERMMKGGDEVTQVMKKAEGQQDLKGGQTRLFENYGSK